MTGTAEVPRADGAQLNSHSVSLPTAQEIGWDRVYEAGCGVKTNFE